jgi:cytochrome b
MGHIILGIIITASGTLMVIKTEWLVNNFGRMAWFEEKLGSEGGTRLGYKLIGLIIIFIGIIIMTGSGSEFMQWLLGPLTKYNQPSSQI